MRKYTLNLLFIILLASCNQTNGVKEHKLFTDLPVLPKNIDNRALYKKIYEGFRKDIPTQENIEVPSYPGSVIFSLTQKNEEKKILPGITILSRDEPEEVLEFYKTRLKNWKFDEQYRILYKAETDFFPFERLNSVPNITVHRLEENTVGKKIMPDAKTYINIIYEPTADKK